MPVDKETLRDVMREAAGDDQEFYSALEKKFGDNEPAATRFMAGFMRNRDYTQKSQAIGQERATFQDQQKVYDGQIQQYRQLLETLEAEKGKIMKQLADRDITVATANAKLKSLKSQYNLSNDEVPDMPDMIETHQKGKVVDTSVDLDQRFADFEKKITTYLSEKLVPELGGMAQLDIVWNDIREEHRDLTGKRLTAKEQQELLNEADKRGRAGKPISLKALWEEKYDAPAMREKHHDDELEKKLRSKWDDEQKAKISEAAMQGIRPDQMAQTGLRTSQILEHKFKVHEDTQPNAAPKMRESMSAAERQSMGGAERAIKRHLERRGQGIPMGAPDERKGTKVA